MKTRRLRSGIAGVRGSMIIRLRPCVNRVPSAHPHPPPPTQPLAVLKTATAAGASRTWHAWTRGGVRVGYSPSRKRCLLLGATTAGWVDDAPLSTFVAVLSRWVWPCDVFSCCCCVCFFCSSDATFLCWCYRQAVHKMGKPLPCYCLFLCFAIAIAVVIAVAPVVDFAVAIATAVAASLVYGTRRCTLQDPE